MKLQHKHTLFFILIFFVGIGILVAFYFFFLIHKEVNHKDMKASSSVIDFDGDGKTDIAVYRASTGGWWIMPSSGGKPYTKGWGGDHSDKPVPGDYDGDGKTDYAIYRKSTGAWYVSPSGGGTPYGIGWGGNTTDLPVTLNLATIYEMLGLI